MTSEIRDAILAKINSPAITKIQVAYRTKSTFAGFPAAVVLVSDNESDYGTTQKDRMVYVFRVKVYYPIKNESEQESVETALEDAIDELIEVFRIRNVLGSACDWVEPVPSAWGEEVVAEAVYRYAQITLRCVKYVG